MTKRKPLFIFSRAAMTLLVMLLTTATAWADVTYSWDETTKTLTINGTGTVTDKHGHNDVKHVIIGTGVTVIDEGAFGWCDDLETVTFENGSILETIGISAFTSCDKLTTIIIPASVKTIGDNAFGYCFNLTDVTIGNGVETIGDEAFQECSITSLTIPEKVKLIGGGAFSFNAFTSVTIPDAVESIGDYAFGSCSHLTDVTIGSGVKIIGTGAFAYCPNLESITLNSNPYFVYGDAFDDIKDGATVTMNLTAKSAGGNYWMTFYNYMYKFQADENTQVFKVELNGSELTLHEVSNRIVDDGTPVILKSTGNPVMTMTTSSSGDSQKNSLKGTSEDLENPVNAYVLSNGNNGVGFYKLKSSGSIGVNKAYLIYSGANSREFFGFGEDEMTAIEAPAVSNVEDGEIYDLQGRRVDHPTKGLYIVDGKKVVIK